MDQNNLQATVTHILDYEGKSKPGLYMDTTQHLTTGPGINVNRKADFMAQNFLDQAGNEIDNATKSKDFDTFLANRNATGQANAAIFNQYQFPPKDFESFVTKPWAMSADCSWTCTWTFISRQWKPSCS